MIKIVVYFKTLSVKNVLIDFMSAPIENVSQLVPNVKHIMTLESVQPATLAILSRQENALFLNLWIKTVKNLVMVCVFHATQDFF